MRCYSKSDLEEMEKRLSVLEATVQAAVNELEDTGGKERMGFGLWQSFHEFRDLFEEAHKRHSNHVCEQ